MTFGDYICKSGRLIDSSPYLGVVYKCQYGRLGDHALSARRCWAPSDDGVGQSFSGGERAWSIRMCDECCHEI